MGKIIKKYNEVTGVWEPILTPDISITQVLEDGDSISDANVVITNENYSSDDFENPATLDKTLSVISDDISKLQRNVSWLAKHGTGGGGGGGGYNISYGFEVTYKVEDEVVPLEKGDSIYTDAGQIPITVTVTGGTPGDLCKVTYQYGGKTTALDNVPIGQPFTFNVTFEKTASVIIGGTNPQGMPIPQFNFRVYKSSLSIRLNAQAAGSNYDPATNVLQMNMSASRGTIPVLVTNGLGSGSTIEYTLTSLNDDGASVPFPAEECNTDTEHASGAVNLWDLIPATQRTPGKVFSLSVSAVARIGSVVSPTAKFNVRVRIINPLDLNLTMSVNGYFDPENAVEVELDTPMNVSFKAYGPNSVRTVYYAGKMTRENGESFKVYGKYFDQDLRDSQDTVIADNDYVYKDTTSLAPPYSLAEGLFLEDEIITLTIRAWSLDANLSAETSQSIRATAIKGYFPRQYGRRRNEPGERKDVMLASWNANSIPSSDNMTWYSNVYGYAPVDDRIESEDVTIEAKVLNGNGYSGVKSGPTRVRLQNNAYLKITIPEEHNFELEALSYNAAASVTNYNGYVISTTFMADETPLTDRVILLWGSNNSVGELAAGIKITNSTVKWAVTNNTVIETAIASGEKHTVDFVLDRRGGYDLINPDGSDVESNRQYYSLAKIYINGVLNNTKKVSGTMYPYQRDIYFGANYQNGVTGNTCDMSLYEFSIYTDLLPDTYLVVNGKNARIENRDEAEFEEYKLWKSKNLLFMDEGSDEVYSKFDSSGFTYEYITTQIAPNSEIPTMALWFNSTSSDEVRGFTESYFYASYSDKSQIQKFKADESYYFDPATKKAIEGVDKWDVELQGTSTLSYRVKNLEIYTRGTWTDSNNVQWPTLFQPKEDWFPEKQFTLKADVVDSAHANNTVIGQWINDPVKCPVLDKTPPMAALASNPPSDIDSNGEQLKNEYNEDAKNTEVSIKHTTEGFPILLFISFAGKDYYIFAGIYSFNLGRYSYYNLGLKFLKSFCRYRDRNELLSPSIDSSCPRLVGRYEETNQLGTIRAENVYSYEFDNLGSDPDPSHPVWSQWPVASDGYQLLSAYGEFKYGTDNPTIRASLASLMEAVATCPLTYTHIYDNLYNHTLNGNGQITQTHSLIVPTRDSYEVVGHKLHLRNAAGYFTIANAFGMTDSLGKNLTLRTWDGVKWYTCFYDMDTALGLDNAGGESIKTNAAIDYVSYTEQGITFRYHSDAIAVDDEGHEVPYDSTDPTQTIIYTPPYAAYKSKLWSLLRATEFLDECREGGEFTDTDVFSSPYTRMWMQLRNSSNSLSKAENFSRLVQEKVGKCGELIYDKDYDSKYIKDNNTTGLLHGTRVEYIKKWLRDHIYFLDGLFDIKGLSSELQRYDGIEDSPYYLDLFHFKGWGKPDGSPFRLRITSTIPTFFSIGIMNEPVKYYIEEAGKEYEFLIQASTNSSTQLQIYGSSLFTRIDGLGPIFDAIRDSSRVDCLKALTSFDVHKAALADAPFSNLKIYLDVDHGGQLEDVDINHATFYRPKIESLDLGGLTKVLRIDVSYTTLGSLVLPDSSLDSLNVTNSTINSLRLEGQNKLEYVSLNGCNDIGEFEVIKCEKMGAMNISSKANLRMVTFSENAIMPSIAISNNKELTGITINSNPELTEVTIDSCEKLESIVIRNNKKLKKLVINNCKNTSVGVSILVEDSALEEITISDVICNGPIVLPSRDKMGDVTTFKLRSCLMFRGIKYGTENIEMYEDGTAEPEMRFVLDLSPMVNLNKRGDSSTTSLTIYNTDVRYIRVRNEEDNPMRIYRDTFEQSKNVERIFGHIELSENRPIFNGYYNFYINHDTNFVPTSYPDGFSFETIVSGEYKDMLRSCQYLYDGIRPEFIEDDEHYTNVSIATSVTKMEEWFASTSCDIHDAYYMLQLCNPRITSIKAMFQTCENVYLSEYQWLDINAFAKCENVTDIDYLFDRCHIDCVIIPEPFVPFIQKLERFDYVLSGNYGILAVGDCFFPDGNKIKEITAFNPRVLGWNEDAQEVATTGYFNDLTLLSTLIKLEILDDCFNNCDIDFSTGRYDATELFKHNVSLQVIKSSFRKIGGVGSLRNIFGGNTSDADITIPSGERAKYGTDKYYPSGLEMVSNSFTFAEGRCTHNDPMFEGDPGPDGILMPLGNSLFKNVPNLMYITGELPGENRTNQEYHEQYTLSDSFIGDGLLKYLDNFDLTMSDPPYETANDCDSDGFPHKIFSGLTQLKEVTALFNNVKNFSGRDLNVNILEDVFADCYSLENISKLFRNMDPSIFCTLTGKEFRNCNLKNVDQLFMGTRLVGQIPFGLFYQEENGVWDNNETYKIEKCTIESMSSIFSGARDYTGQTQYTATADDLVMDNPDYSSSAAAGTKNACKKIWNLYAYDGSASSDFEPKMNAAISRYGSDLYTAENPFAPYIEHVGSKWTLDLNDMDEATGYALGNDNYRRMFMKPNYFCPPDIFKYCKNFDNLNISRALTRVSGEYKSGSISGFRGRIPEMIFQPLTLLSFAHEVFSENYSLFPYYWFRRVNGVETRGEEYPPMLFENLELQEINGMFANTRMWPKSLVPVSFFSPIAGSIRSVANLWNNAKWIERYYDGLTVSQLPDDLFTGCTALISVSGMLGDSYNDSIAYINGDSLLSKTHNNNIRSCRSFLIHASSTHGSVPTFWLFDHLPPQNSEADVLGALAGCQDPDRFSNAYDLVNIPAYGGNEQINPYLMTVQ